MNSRSASATD
jgi:hypothetical protein